MHSSQFGITFTDLRGPVNSDGPIHCIRSLNRMVRYSVMPLPAYFGGALHFCRTGSSFYSLTSIFSQSKIELNRFLDYPLQGWPLFKHCLYLLCLSPSSSFVPIAMGRLIFIALNGSLAQPISNYILHKTFLHSG